MKKSELKNILKPLVKECVKEVILDEGILSGIISEVARGMGGVQINETRSTAKPKERDPIVERMKPLAGQAPGDSGVDISNLFGSVGRNWNAHMDNVSEGK